MLVCIPHYTLLLDSLVILSLGSGKWIYDKLKSALNTAASDISKSLRSNLSGPADWLTSLVAATKWFGDSVKLLESLLTYLDRAYIPHHPDLKTIKSATQRLFKTATELYLAECCLWSCTHFKFSTLPKLSIALATASKSGSHASARRGNLFAYSEATRSLSYAVHFKRKHHQHRGTVKELAVILHEYSRFHPLFFDPLLEQTQRFYQAESENLSGPNAFKERPGEFLVHCGKRISEETQRSKEVLGAFPWCENEIQKATEEALLRGRLQWLCGGAFSFVPLCLLFESI